MSDAARGSQVAFARLAGAMFLLVDALMVLQLSIAGRLQVPGDVVATAHRAAQSELLYRVELSSGLLAALCTVLIGVGLYGALRPVGRTLAVTGLVFRTAEGTLFGVQAVFAFAFLKLYTGIDTSGFNPEQLAALWAVRSAAGDAGYNVATLFFGFGSTAFFYLFLKSGYIPRWLALLGFVGSLLVPVASFGSLVFKVAGTAYWALWAPIGAAEIITAIWLLVRGLDLRARPEPAAAVAEPAGRP